MSAEANADTVHEQHRFVIEDLDERHLFIVPDPKVISFIEKKMDEWNEKNTYQPPTQ
jgi:TFIIH basal transcription factor complex TTD-A subunit